MEYSKREDSTKPPRNRKNGYSVSSGRKIAGYDTQIASLSAQIDAETARAEEIEEYRKYTQTKAYVEEVAKDKLGLVYEGEILFKEDN